MGKSAINGPFSIVNQLLMGKSTISMAMFNSKLLVYQKVAWRPAITMVQGTSSLAALWPRTTAVSAAWQRGGESHDELWGFKPPNTGHLQDIIGISIRRCDSFYMDVYIALFHIHIFIDSTYHFQWAVFQWSISNRGKPNSQPKFGMAICEHIVSTLADFKRKGKAKNHKESVKSQKLKGTFWNIRSKTLCFFFYDFHGKKRTKRTSGPLYSLFLLHDLEYLEFHFDQHGQMPRK